MNTINNVNELESFVSDFLKNLKQGTAAIIVSLSGNLGAGKTTFVQSAARYFNIDETITSPTFVIQKEYQITDHNFIKKMIHIDAYRLEDKSELEYLGWNEIISNPENIIFIEWPEHVSGISMPNTLSVDITILDNDSRKITITS